MASLLANSLTLKDIISYYLYGAADLPKEYEARLRPDVTTENYGSTKLQIDAPDFMANGPGRYANLSQVPLIQAMLTEASGIPQFLAAYNLSGRTVFTVADLRAGGLPLSDIEMTLSQYQMDTASSDYMARSYIWSSELFKLNDDAVIDLSDVNNPIIKNVNLRPFDDNFDYFSSNVAIQVSNQNSMNTVDPYAIGRTVELNFADADAIAKAGTKVGGDYIYNLTSYQSDTVRWNAQYNGNIVDGFLDVFLAGNAEIQRSGILNYDLSGGGSVIFGNDSDNVINSITGYSNSLSVKHVANGIDVWYSSDSDPVNASHFAFPQNKDTIVISGAGKDVITTGAGSDIILSGRGEDQVFLNGGVDKVSLGADNDKIDVTIKKALNSFTVVYGGQGVDTFNINSADDANSLVFSLSIDGLNDQNFESLDIAKIQAFVQSQITSAGEQSSNYDGIVVILNPSSEDKLELNGSAVGDPTSFAQYTTTKDGQTSAINPNTPGGPNGDGERRVDTDNHLKMVGDGQSTIGTAAYFSDAWNVSHSVANQYGLQLNNVTYALGTQYLSENGNYYAQNLLYMAGINVQDSDIKYTEANFNGSTQVTLTNHYEGVGWSVQVAGFNIGDFGVSFSHRDDLSSDFNVSGSLYSVNEWAEATETTLQGLPYITGIKPKEIGDLIKTYSEPALTTSGLVSSDSFAPERARKSHGLQEFADGVAFQKSTANQHFGGSSGTDTVDYSTSTSGIGIDLGQGIGTSGGAAGDDFVSIENAIGSAFNDSIVGGDGSNVITGGGGGDLIAGGLGNDTYVYAVSDGSDVIDDVGGVTDQLSFVNLTATNVYLHKLAQDLIVDVNSGGVTIGSITIKNQFDENLKSGIEEIAFGDGVVWESDTIIRNTNGIDPPPPNIINGTIADDVLVGTAGNDTIDGGLGNDSIDGRAGDDILYGQEGGDVLNGGEGADTLYGQDGSDILSGGAGNDFLDGGTGDDTYIVDSLDDAVVEGENAGTDTVKTDLGNYSLASLTNVENLVYTGSLAFTGSGNSVTNTITGGAGNDTLDGGSAGDDILNGGSGDDVLIGSIGNDTENGGAGDDVLYGHEGDDALDGGDGADTIYGQEGNDILVGGAGNDFLDGGTGNDTYIVDSLSDTVAEGDDAGVDTVKTGLSSYSLASVINVENIVYTGTTSFTGGGNDADNVITGGTGNDTLDGGSAGDDTLNGGSGDDVLIGGIGNDTEDGGDGDDVLYGQEGDDALSGGDGADTLYGQEGNDLLSGGAGNDYLDGGEGNDALTGGLGADTFGLAFNGSLDTLTDFSPNLGDIILFDRASFGIPTDASVADYITLGSASPNAGHGYILANSTGIYWDADGSNAGAAIKIADFQTAPTEMSLSSFALA